MPKWTKLERRSQLPSVQTHSMLDKFQEEAVIFSEELPSERRQDNSGCIFESFLLILKPLHRLAMLQPFLSRFRISQEYCLYLSK